MAQSCLVCFCLENDMITIDSNVMSLNYQCNNNNTVSNKKPLPVISLVLFCCKYLLGAFRTM